jgi:hypothetical protein
LQAVYGADNLTQSPTRAWKNMPFFAYGYFVRLAPGQIVHSGHDFGQTLDSYSVGDSLGIRDGKEGIVIGILKGKPAQRSGGYDVFVLIEERTPRVEGSGPTASWDFFQSGEGRVFLDLLMRDPPRLVSRPQIQAALGTTKFRAVGKTIHRRPLNESFYDFQVHHFLWLLGKDWFDVEMAKPLEERHIILKWRAERNEQLRKYQDPKEPDALIRAPVTGGMRALQVLADDLYQLAHALDPPRKILSRLRDMKQFQGARYEILTASLFARCGFEINFIEDTSKRNPEFVATKDGERIAVEAKSRHRSGVLNERGAYRGNAAPQIRRLYEQAAGQNPRDCPFLIFIDVNLPLTPNVPPLEKPWIVEAMKVVSDREQEGLQSRDTALILTNFGWHFSREEGAPPGENFSARVEYPNYPIEEKTWELLYRAISEYGKVVDEEERK